jgi:hypothetical protein
LRQRQCRTSRGQQWPKGEIGHADHHFIRDGIAVEAGSRVVRLTGFVDTPKMGAEDAERRIVARLSLSRDAATKLWDDLVNAGIGMTREEIHEIASDADEAAAEVTIEYIRNKTPRRDN